MKGEIRAPYESWQNSSDENDVATETTELDSSRHLDQRPCNEKHRGDVASMKINYLLKSLFVITDFSSIRL